MKELSKFTSEVCKNNETLYFDSEFRILPQFFFNMYINELTVFAAWEKLQNYIKRKEYFPMTVMLLSHMGNNLREINLYESHQSLHLHSKYFPRKRHYWVLLHRSGNPCKENKRLTEKLYILKYETSQNSPTLDESFLKCLRNHKT